MGSFSAKIQIIGVNPYVLLPSGILKELFERSGKSKGPIPVKGELNGNKFIQTLVKYSGKWRLYLNTPMRKAAGIDVGDIAKVKIEFDPGSRVLPIPAPLVLALSKNKKAREKFSTLAPYRQKEIVRYIGALKSADSVKKNVAKVIKHLTGKERFAGRD